MHFRPKYRSLPLVSALPLPQRPRRLETGRTGTYDEKLASSPAPIPMATGIGKCVIEALGIRTITQSKEIKDVEIKRFGKDYLVSGYL